VALIQERIDQAVRRETGGNRVLFEKKLAAAGMTMAEFKERMHKEVAADLLLREKVLRHIRVIPHEIGDYYRTHTKELTRPPRYRLEVIRLRADADDVDETIAGIRKKLKQGTPFAELAKQYSNDPSAAMGGDRGLIEDLNKHFRAAVAPLKVGEVSPENIRIGKKIYIVRLADKDVAGVPPLHAELRRRIEALLRRRQRQQRYDAYLAKLHEKYYVVTADELNK
jgi:peptidyl-prolyl cis-trans isomerase C/peptidyl-prolyl cis-trans isomerase SurA